MIFIESYRYGDCIMDKKELELLIENFPDKPVLRRYKTYIENKDMC